MIGNEPSYLELNQMFECKKRENSYEKMLTEVRAWLGCRRRTTFKASRSKFFLVLGFSRRILVDSLIFCPDEVAIVFVIFIGSVHALGCLERRLWILILFGSGEPVSS